jgi:hypothetical protein
MSARFRETACVSARTPSAEDVQAIRKTGPQALARGPILLAKWIRLDGPAGAAAGGQLEMLPHRIHSLFTISNTRMPPHTEQDMRVPVPAGLLRTAPQISLTVRTKHKTARPHGGARRDRTDDLMLAKHALSQLSYGPFGVGLKRRRRRASPQAVAPSGAAAGRPCLSPRGLRSRDDDRENGGPGTTRTSDLTLIRGAL